MKRDLFSFRAAVVFSLVITILMHLFIALVILFGRNVLLADGAGEMHRDHSPEMEMWQMLLSLLSVFLFCLIIFIINFKILKAELKRYRLFTIITASVVATVVLTCLLVNAQLFLSGADLGEYYARTLLGNMIKDFMLTLVIVFTSQILYLTQKKQQIAFENEQLLAENIKSRYEKLKSQVDPHFLFNTLNTLNTMIKVDPDRAQEYVQKMSSVFRYTLQNKEELKLEDELKFTRDYCLLMQIRYGDSLVFRFDTDKKYDCWHIIPLSIQTLVENAIKHNIITKRQPLTVTVATHDNDTLTVSNPLQVKKESEPGAGIGLANLTERYRLRFGREVEVSCCHDVFRVTLPLIERKTNL